MDPRALLGLRTIFAALSSEELFCPYSDAEDTLPFAEKILFEGSEGPGRSVIRDCLHEYLWKHSIIRDEGTDPADYSLTTQERESYIAHAGFEVGVATCYLIMTAVNRGVR